MYVCICRKYDSVHPVFSLVVPQRKLNQHHFTVSERVGDVQCTFGPCWLTVSIHAGAPRVSAAAAAQSVWGDV